MARPPGRTPVPSAILEKQGDPEVSRRKGEPRPPPGRPRCPAWLDKESKAAWRILLPQLDAMGVAHRVDRTTLANYVRAWSRWRAAEAFLIEHGTTYPVRGKSPGVYPEGHAEAGLPIPGPIKEFRPFPQVKEANQLLGILNRIGAEFGLSPATRVRLRGQVEEFMGPRKKEPEGKVLGKGRFLTRTG